MIVIRDVWKRYGKLEVLKGLSLDIQDGETLVILGRSGVGKSVLLKQIIGLEKPDKGTIHIDDILISDRKYNAKKAKPKRTIGMLFQGAALFDSMTVGENTAFYLRQNESGLSEKEIQGRVSDALEMVGLGGTQNKMPADLSGGMRKRAGLARLIVYRPNILLYDEPTTGLDPITSMQISELINQTKKELNATSIVVTHDMRSAMEIADTFAFNHDGRISHAAPKHKFMDIDDPLLKNFFENAILTEAIMHAPSKTQ